MAKDEKVIAEQLAQRQKRVADITTGNALPTTKERLAGYPPLSGDEGADRIAFLTIKIDEVSVLDGDVELYERARDAIDAEPLWDLWTVLKLNDPTRDRMLVYLALGFFDAEAQDLLAGIVRRDVHLSRNPTAVDAVYSLSMATMLELRPMKNSLLDLRSRLDAALLIASRDAEDILAVKAAMGAKAAATPIARLSPLSALSRLAHQLDDAEKSRRQALVDVDPNDLVPAARSLVVVPELGEPTGSSARKDVLTQFKPIGAVPLPIADVVDAARVHSDLVTRYPHFAVELDLILRQVRPFRLLLVGSPGSGKTSLARDLATALGMPSVVYPAGGTSDASFAGTSAQWATARASTTLQAVLRHRRADPLIVLDELEKAGSSRNNGSFVDAALTFLEPSSARRILDPALEVECDLSAVSYVATANSLEGVPRALLDRLRVIRMPDPRPEHAIRLIGTMFDDIANERGLDRRWIEPLAADEMEIVTEAWPGGSLRRLRRVLELLLDGREQNMGRA